MHLRFVAMLSFVLVLLPGCHPLKVKEVLEGSDAWVRELTRSMDMEVVADTNVSSGEEMHWSIRIANRGEYEPHVSTLMIMLLDTPGKVSCRVERPAPREVDHDEANGYIYFLLTPVRVASGTTTVVSGRCMFSSPGRYRLLLSGSFAESSVAFVSEILTVEVR